ncbi:MAG: hypothetical protein WAZ98_02395 [Cyclobacteriaceae bacterium]
MPRKTLLSAFPLLLIFTVACGPLVPLNYTAQSPGNQVQIIETSEATVFLEYVESKFNHYIFDLEVVNHSTSPLWAAPQLISFYASPKPFIQLRSQSENVHALSAPNSALTLKRQFANSPAVTRKIYIEKIKEKRAFAALFAIIGTGLAIHDAVQDSEDSQKETWTKEDEKKSVGRDLLVSAALTASDVARESSYEAEDESQYIPYELFPECKVSPSSSMRGKIFIPKETSYRYSRVVVPIGNTDYVFDFKRRSVKTTQSQSPHHPLADDPHK